jgi:hypothetical protein
LTKFDPDFRTARLSTHKEIASLKGPNGLSQFRPFFHKELNRQTAAYDQQVKPLEEAQDEGAPVLPTFRLAPAHAFALVLRSRWPKLWSYSPPMHSVTDCG